VDDPAVLFVHLAALEAERLLEPLDGGFGV
jgi:hypothetical protein